jgi:hypothetical protein
VRRDFGIGDPDTAVAVTEICTTRSWPPCGRQCDAATMIGLHHVPPELLRGTNPPGQKMMAAAVEVPADASPQDRMLAFTGRRP